MTKLLPPEPTQEMIDRMTASIDCIDVPTSDDPPDRDYDYEMRKAYRALYAVLTETSAQPAVTLTGNTRATTDSGDRHGS